MIFVILLINSFVMKDKNTTLLVITIVFTSIIIAGSLVFLGAQIGNGGVSAVDIQKGIEDYVAQQQGDSDQQKGEIEPKVISGDKSDDDAFLGDADAPVTLVEFSDFQCPYCRSFYNETFSQIKEQYVDTGKVKFVYRDFPLSFHDGAVPAALAAECARDQGGDDIFFAMHDLIFEGQNELGDGTVKIPNESLMSYAEELSLDMNEFKDCFESEKYIEEISDDFNEGQRIGITGTPGFVLEGELISGAQPFSVFSSAIDKALDNK